MPEPMSELDKFLGDVNQTNDSDIFKLPEQQQPQEGQQQEEGKKKEETPEEGEEGRKNRRHRRLEQQLAESRENERVAREAAIAAEARAAGRAETGSESIDARLLRMYGDTPEGKEAARIHQELLTDTHQRARQEAMDEFRAAQAAEAAAERQYADRITSELEALEDEHNVDLTSSSPAATKARNDFLDLIQSVSPKNTDGSLAGFADFGSTFELFKSRQQAQRTGQSQERRELAARTMEPSGAVDVQKAEDDQQLAWLRRMGIKV
jgi:hypothetical protein